MTGTIFNIQHYALHDGPGIRTTVFFKGCPLGCWWCHNPESLSTLKQLVFWPERCLHCGRCLAHCSQAEAHPVSMPEETKAAPAAAHCQRCGLCAQACPTEALEMSGNEMTVDEVMKQLEKDDLFYIESGGGVTFSGGEPLMQPDFLILLLQACKKKGWHTTLDTCGHAPLEVLQRVAPLVDLFLFDIKHMDEGRHKVLTGVSNRLIFSNLEWLIRTGKDILIRVPVIPGINDDIDHFHSLGRYLQQQKLTRVHLLPYHAIGADKYARRGMTYRLPQLKRPSQEHLDKLTALLSAYDLDIFQGG